MCRTKHQEIFSHNAFSVLAEEFSINENLDSNAMVSKFIDTANKVGNEIHARIPNDLKGSAFHCPAYIKKLSHEKHLLFYRIRKFELEPDLSNLQLFLKLNSEYANLSDYIKNIKKTSEKYVLKILSKMFVNFF